VSSREVDRSLTLCKIRCMATSRIPTLPPKEALILELLAEHSEMYGLQLVAASKRRLKRGTVYVTLGRMEEKGFITSRLESAAPDEGGLPRRIYQPTAFGRRVLSAYAHVVRRLTPEPAR
jgi:PadR family transcriptional regulator PadR